MAKTSSSKAVLPDSSRVHESEHPAGKDGQLNQIDGNNIPDEIMKRLLVLVRLTDYPLQKIVNYALAGWLNMEGDMMIDQRSKLLAAAKTDTKLENNLIEFPPLDADGLKSRAQSVRKTFRHQSVW